MSLRAYVAKQSPVKRTKLIELFFSQNTEIASTGERRLAMT